MTMSDFFQDPELIFALIGVGIGFVLATLFSMGRIGTLKESLEEQKVTSSKTIADLTEEHHKLTLRVDELKETETRLHSQKGMLEARIKSDLHWKQELEGLEKRLLSSVKESSRTSPVPPVAADQDFVPASQQTEIQPAPPRELAPAKPIDIPHPKDFDFVPPQPQSPSTADNGFEGFTTQGAGKAESAANDLRAALGESPS